MRPFLVVILLAALSGDAGVVSAQDSQPSDQQRKGDIDNLFADAARYRDAQQYDLCLDSLNRVVKLANTRDSFKQKDEAALYRATNEIIAIRTRFSRQADQQSIAVSRIRDGIHRLAVPSTIRQPRNLHIDP